MSDKAPNIEQEPPPKKRWFRLTGWRVLFLTIFGAILFFLTPFMSWVTYIIPETALKSMMASVYQDILLDDSGTELREPRKLQTARSLPVLGGNTGVCFTFNSTISNENAALIDENRLVNARRGTMIAEIIAMTADKEEFTLKNTDFYEQIKKDEGHSMICQKFGSAYSRLPKEISSIYLRPLYPFTPSRITWVSTKDF